MDRSLKRYVSGEDKGCMVQIHKRYCIQCMLLGAEVSVCVPVCMCEGGVGVVWVWCGCGMGKR